VITVIFSVALLIYPDFSLSLSKYKQLLTQLIATSLIVYFKTKKGDRTKWYWTQWYGQNGSSSYTVQYNWIYI